jgi:selenide,water dikinase
MLPGLIAGHYTIDDIHIDLRRLCTWAGVRFIEQTMTAVDLEQRKVRFTDRPALDFDVLSLDTGSTPDLSVEGSREHVTPVKPVHSFYARWQAILERLSTPSSTGVSIGVVGSGAGGFELVSAMRYRLPEERCRLHWFLMNDLPLEGRPRKVGQLALSAARRNGIIIHSGFEVTRVEQGSLYARDGRHTKLDEILWCTAAAGPSWPVAAGLTVDTRGFVATNACLQSISHDFVFASGDIGTQIDSPSAKAGVYAVRQAPYLFENLRRHILGETLSPFHPQDDFLSLMATGGKRAIASRGPLAVEADWVWRWKDHIDRRFMQKFSTLPPMQSNANLQRLPDALKARYAAPSVDGERAASMRCRGCGSKVSRIVVPCQLP